jgi:predicted CoA-binding protein
MMMTPIAAFLSSPAFAVVGVSRNERKFGSIVFRAMRSKGFAVYPVHPHLSEFDGVACVPDVRALPSEVRAAVLVVPPAVAMKVLMECNERGIRNVWLQPGAESHEAIRYAEEHGMNLVHHECVLMFIEPVTSIHALHRWMKKLIGTYPQ